MTFKRKRELSSSSDSDISDSDGSETSSIVDFQRDPPNPSPDSVSFEKGKLAF